MNQGQTRRNVFLVITLHQHAMDYLSPCPSSALVPAPAHRSPRRAMAPARAMGCRGGAECNGCAGCRAL